MRAERGQKGQTDRAGRPGQAEDLAFTLSQGRDLGQLRCRPVPSGGRVGDRLGLAGPPWRRWGLEVAGSWIILRAGPSGLGGGQDWMRV